MGVAFRPEDTEQSQGAVAQVLSPCCHCLPYLMDLYIFCRGTTRRHHHPIPLLSPSPSKYPEIKPFFSLRVH